MTRPLSMAYLTGHGLGPVEAVHLAADLGFDRIGLRMLPSNPADRPPPLLSDDALFDATRAALRDTGLKMADLEMVRLTAETDLDSLRPLLERGQDLGARHLLVVGLDPDRARLTDNYGKLCDLTWQHGISADLEFLPWSPVKSLADARALVEAVSHPAAAILLDALHFDRCDSTLDDIAALPRGMLNYVQICDGPVPYDPSEAELIRVARSARLCPGDGGIDPAAILAQLPADMPISIEVVNDAHARAEGIPALVKRALDSTRALLS